MRKNGSNGHGTSAIAQFVQNLARTMPPMMQILNDIGGVELPDYIAKLTPESRLDSNGTTAATVETSVPPRT